MDQIEIWKDVEGYYGRYQVSNLGNVRSIDYELSTTLTRKGKQDPTTEMWRRRGKILKRIYPQSTPVVHLFHPITKHRENITVKRLVARAFLPDFDYRISTNSIICIDGDPDNCSVLNLKIRGYKEEN